MPINQGTKMKLICDDHNQVYVWVEDFDSNIELSPHFDYEEDAVQWQINFNNDILKEKNANS